MDIKVGAKYKTTNTVIEFVEDKLIAWKHIGKHIWRYDLVDNADGTTIVTETWDWSPCPWLERKGLEIMGFPEKNRKNINLTLTHLSEIITANN